MERYDMECDCGRTEGNNPAGNIWAGRQTTGKWVRYEDVPQWVSVLDQVPEDARSVLTYSRQYGKVIGCFEWGDNEDPCWWANGEPAQFKTAPTHWQPLPPKPEDA